MLEADSPAVWKRANSYVLAADDGNGLTEAERREIHAALAAQPPLTVLASIYVELILFAALHAGLFVTGAILFPAMLLHLLYLGLRKILGG